MMDKFFKVPHPYFLLDSDLSRQIERKTIKEIGIDGFTLMEIAGSSAAKIILSQNREPAHGIFLCGKGNNGGDALVVARYLVQYGFSATIVFLSGTGKLSAGADKNLRLLETFAADEQLVIRSGWKEFDDRANFDFIVDGMLGTGLESDVRKDYARAAEWANSEPAPVLSMDIPTGLHTDSGKIMGVAVKAAQTFAFGGRKTGYYLNEGPGITGGIHYCELPFPNSYKEECSTFLIDSSWTGKPERKPGRHKYDSGVLYIIAGSEGLTGAGIMAAQSAWAEGLGAVILICPKGILPAFEHQLPGIIKKPVGSRTDYCFKEVHQDPVSEVIREKPGTVLIGPGLGRNPETASFVNRFLKKHTADILIDADALWALSQNGKWEKPEEANWILTPHPGELAGFISYAKDDARERLDRVKKLSRDKNIILLSKGMPGIVAMFDGRGFITAYDTRPFARAGSGDVLAGKVAAFWSLDNAAGASCIFGLLNGKEKFDKYTLHNEKFPEPRDLI